MGTHDSLLASSQFVQTIQQRQGMQIACIEEVARFMGFIEHEDLVKLSQSYPDSGYGKYVKFLAAHPEIIYAKNQGE
ncbi:Glucose-1-phosphate thymidylyltransferase 2 [compost metagenome]